MQTIDSLSSRPPSACFSFRVSYSSRVSKRSGFPPLSSPGGAKAAIICKTGVSSQCDKGTFTVVGSFAAYVQHRLHTVATQLRWWLAYKTASTTPQARVVESEPGMRTEKTLADRCVAPYVCL
jgi:hypothetical protein